MKSMNDIRCIPKKAEDRAEGLLLHSQPFNLLDGKNKPSSWQRPTKRKFPSSACDPLPQARKPESTLRTSRGVRPQRQLACIRKSLSDPLRVFGDGDGSDNQHSSLSGTTPSDSKDGLPKGLPGQHEMMDMENLSKEKKRGLKPGLKDSTNLDPKAALKQNSLHLYNEVLALKEALRAEKEAHRCLQAELDQERNASSSAANEAMAMIARLQEEKAAVLMEARQFKRMAEERELHNQEAISLLKDMLLNKEDEALALENELATCRQMFLAIEAGEPAENYDMKYLDIGSYRGRTLESELESAHSEGLKSWTSSFYDSKQFNVCVNDPSRETFQGEPTNSEFNGRRYGRSFKDLVSDNVRSNLESYFIQAGESLEEPQQYSDVDFKRELSKIMYDRTVESNRSVDMLKRSSKGSQGAIHGESKLSNDGGESVFKVATTPLSLGKTDLGGSVQPAMCFTDEQNRSLWERIMKLEHRLETFGVDEEGFKGFECELQGNVAAASQTPGFTSSTQRVEMSPSDDGHCSQEANTKGNNSVERPTKLQCRGGSHGLETSARQNMDSVVSSQQNQFQVSIGVSARNCSNAMEEHCEIARDTTDGVLDIYEVGYQINEGSQNDCCKSPVDDDSYKHHTNALENADLPPELTAPDLETMDVESHASIFSPPDTLDVRNMSSSLSGAEKQQLNLRLQALESEKHAMHQAILLLQTENKELRNIASKLQELKKSQSLKRNVQSSEQPSKRAKSEQPSFTSFLRGFFSYLPSSTSINSQERSLALRDPGSGSMQRDHVGLSHLLENSPHLMTDTLIVRGLKVKVPAAV